MFFEKIVQIKKETNSFKSAFMELASTSSYLEKTNNEEKTNMNKLKEFQK